MSVAVKSLRRRKHELALANRQVAILSDHTSLGIPAFEEKLKQIELLPLKPVKTEIFQVNLGKMCNQVCKHCHVDAGPDRKEIMTKEVMGECLIAITSSSAHTVDMTGGAPEMNPNFRWFVEKVTRLGKKVIVRCNLTIILANPAYNDLPAFFKEHRVNVVSSLPYFNARRTDSQRGEGVFEKSIKALKMLNDIGYGLEEDLKLDLVYNPAGAFLPGDQSELEAEFKQRLRDKYSIEFNDLYAITNIPVSRFLEYLQNTQHLESYMAELVNNFNSAAAMGVMCRNTISVGWNGYLYDCDFNQMLELKVDQKAPQHISTYNEELLLGRAIKVNQHCFGCTAGAGSSCGGATA
ncbi:MAG: arsenosugar biosynthesis radical SAM (seleno)protein ArsS [Cyclobacteriaceae bacterium]